MKRRCVIDEGIGETRAAVYEGRNLVELYIRRWSERNRPQAGDVFLGRIDTVDVGMGAAYVELGSGKPGFLKFSDAPKAPRFQNGQYVDVEVTREGGRDKGPVLRFRSVAEKKKPGPISQLSLSDRISKRFQGDIAFEAASVSSLLQVCDTEIALPGGGDIAIEPTRALIAVDVDRGSGKNGFDVSKAAAIEVARQLRLRGLGGLIAIDFPNLRQKRQREDLLSVMTDAVSKDPNPVKIAPLSRFGVMELTRQKQERAIDEILLGPDGQPTAETLALSALQRLEREGRSSPGSRLTLSVPDKVKSWLDEDDIDWKKALTERIGARFVIEAGDQIDVKADR